MKTFCQFGNKFIVSALSSKNKSFNTFYPDRFLFLETYLLSLSGISVNT